MSRGYNMKQFTSKMSLWSWKKSGWVNCTLTASLIMAVIIGICSAGFRTGFKAITPSFSFYGGILPEIGIFNILLYLSSVFGFFSVVLRYSYILDEKQVMSMYNDYLNKSSVVAGIFSFLGLIMIASFPVSPEEKENQTQSAGVYIFIGLGVLFTALQTVLTYTSIRCSTTFSIRLLLAASLISTFTSSIVLIERSKYSVTDITKKQDNESEQIFGPAEMDQALLIACALEWTSVVVYALYFLSFVEEFQRISSYVILRPLVIPNPSDFRSSSLTVNERV